jgi:NAD/NADP transhydrogenase alpha subunit
MAAAASAEAPAWVWNLVQGLVGLLLTVVGLYLGATVKGLRKDVSLLREEYTEQAKRIGDIDTRVAVVENVCEERHGGGATAKAGG